MLTQDEQRCVARLRKAILACVEMSEEARVAAYNAATSALRAMVSNLVGDDPVLGVKIRRAEEVVANDYNPNRVAAPELDLLEQSIRADGVTMPVVTCRREGEKRSDIVDGFHRHLVLTARLGRKYVPCSEIDKPLAERMASTVRHNRARGKHQVDLQAALVKAMLDLGLGDEGTAARLGMSVEELLRLKQIVGAAKLLAGVEYSASYGRDDEPDDLADE